MQTFQDFLIWYNNLDVKPFCDALEKMCAFWEEKNIDMLPQGIFIPGVILAYLFTTLESDIFFFYLQREKQGFVLSIQVKYGLRP